MPKHYILAILENGLLLQPIGPYTDTELAMAKHTFDGSVDVGRHGGDLLLHLTVSPDGTMQAVLRPVHTNIAEWKLVETQLERRLQEESLRSLVDHSVDSIITIDERGIIQSCGGAVKKIFGYLPSELVGRSVTALMPEPWRNEHDRYISSYLRTGVAKIMGNVREVIGLRKDGSTVPLEIAVTEFSLGSDRFFTGILRDISERKKLEDRLRQSQKLEAIGQLAAGVAHDFNNLLTIINGYSELLLTEQPQDSPGRMLLAEIRQAGERAASLTSQLLAFSRKQVLQPKVLNLNDAIGNTEKMLQRMIGEDISLVTDFDPTLNAVKVDPGQIDQVVMNLAVNARDAMPQGGRLTIATRNVDLDEKGCQEYPGLTPGNYVMVSVTDTGCGIPPEVMARIFEPFFSTKELGKGTGLGLATVYGIVKQSDGHIAVDSLVGAGTTFKLFFPVVAERTTPPSHHDTALARRGNETVLLVEDEEAVRRLARLQLEMRGYKVLEASGGQEAIRVARDYDGPIHLLVTDVVMPEMSGGRLVESLRPDRPEMKVLYMSGYNDDALVRHGITEETGAFLQKPFSLPLLATKVREVLDGKI